MTRNYFSKLGGPCFINNGVTHHEDKPKNIKLDQGLLLSIAIGGSILLITIVALVVAF